MKKVFIVRHSLKYDGNDIYIYHVTRERYADMQNERKHDRYSDYYFERVTARKAVKMRKEFRREQYEKEYNTAIAKKYGVSENWKNNRWFVEQVRPSLY